MEVKRHIELAKRLTVLLDTKYTFLGIKFGLDPLLSIIPGLGSLVGGIVSCYVIWIAVQLKVSVLTYVKIVWNIFIDLVFGAIPFVGVFLDVFYKSNVRNLKLLESYINLKVKN